MWVEAEEIVEHWVYNATQNNQTVALMQMLLIVWIVTRNNKLYFLAFELGAKKILAHVCIPVANMKTKDILLQDLQALSEINKYY